MANKQQSSYQRMKEKLEKQIAELTDDVITLVENTSYLKVSQVRTKWSTRLEIEKVIWSGNPSIDLSEPKMPFGQFEGFPMSEVDPAYLLYLYDKDKIEPSEQQQLVKQYVIENLKELRAKKKNSRV